MKKQSYILKRAPPAVQINPHPPKEEKKITIIIPSIEIVNFL
jgi:hypothetical protein